MKKITTLLTILVVGFGFAQENKNSRDKFKPLEAHTETKILYDQVSAISKTTEIKQEGIEHLYYMQVYHEMQRADFLNRLPKINFLEEEARSGFANEYIPLFILICEFEALKLVVKSDKLLSLNSSDQYEITDNSIDYFDKHSIGVISPLVSRF
jgi:hypothetical protein